MFTNENRDSTCKHASPLPIVNIDFLCLLSDSHDKPYQTVGPWPWYSGTILQTRKNTVGTHFIKFSIHKDMLYHLSHLSTLNSSLTVDSGSLPFHLLPWHDPLPTES